MSKTITKDKEEFLKLEFPDHASYDDFEEFKKHFEEEIRYCPTCGNCYWDGCVKMCGCKV